VLSNINLTLLPGEVTALVGRSGAGKSTLLQLLLRFYDPNEGSILLNGTDLRDFHLGDLRRLIGLVLQEPILLAATIRENIAFARPDAPLAAVVEAARQANADGFISRLPGGYYAMVVEGSLRLSVGEKQRINLARAFLKDAPILLLDEPTSALDVESETLVIEGLRRLMVGRTTLLVAHRLETVRQAAQMVVLDEGRIVEVGPPSELLARGKGGFP
jgi:ATP-binding cassette, subfamily B, bacterial